MSKTTTEHVQYGIQFPNGETDWAPSNEGSTTHVKYAGQSFMVVGSDGLIRYQGVTALRQEIASVAARNEHALNLPEGTVPKAELVRRTVLIVTDDPEIVA